MKFLQGVPVIGAVGGAYDVVYMKQITEYANLKYKRRFLRVRRGGTTSEPKVGTELAAAKDTEMESVE